METRNLFHKAGSKWPIYGIQRKNKKQILRNSRENKAQGVHIRLVIFAPRESPVMTLKFFFEKGVWPGPCDRLNFLGGGMVTVT